MRQPQRGVVQPVPYSTAPEGLMRQPQRGVVQSVPYNTSPKGLMRPIGPPRPPPRPYKLYKFAIFPEFFPKPVDSFVFIS
jgi:hypothetical protein